MNQSTRGEGYMTPIRATDERIVPYSQCEVWKVLVDIAAYPAWWPRTVGLRILHREVELVGSSFELRPFGGRSFCCRIESVEEPNMLRMRYYGGFIDGRGEWRLQPVGLKTRVVYELDVRAAGRIVAWIGRLLPLSRLHSFQMNGVLRQLEKKVEKNAKSGIAQ